MRVGKIAALGVISALGLGIAPKAHATYTAYIYQDGSNVVAAGSGSLDLTDLTSVNANCGSDGVEPRSVNDYLQLGSGCQSTVYTGVFSGPAGFGSGPAAFTSGTGPTVGIWTGTLAQIAELRVPQGYVSGTVLDTSTDTWDNTTLAGLGVNDGTYVWTWGTGLDADSFTLNIGPLAVPEPASLTLLGTGLAAFGLNRRRRHKGA